MRSRKTQSKSTFSTSITDLDTQMMKKAIEDYCISKLQSSNSSLHSIIGIKK